MIRIITPFHNTEKYIGFTLASINMQTYTDWKCYICNDASTDGSVELIQKLIEGKDKFELINSKEQIGTTGHHYNTIHKDEILDEDIIIDMDGDDWFAHENVFEQVIKAYSDNKTWMTYGSFVHWDGKGTTDGFANPPKDGCANVRKVRYTTTAMRTYKAWLFRKIEKDDLQIDGKFFQEGGDLAFMYPMLEMSGDNRSKYLKEVSYIYNIETSKNDYKVDLPKQTKNANYLRNKKPYKCLDVELDKYSIKLYDLEFQNQRCAGNLFLEDYKPKDMEWYRGDDYREVAILTDRMMPKVDECDSKYKIAMLCEPRAINQSNYAYIEENYQKFDYIFTFDEKLLAMDNKFQKLLWGGCWIPHSDCKIHDKNKNLSIIASKKGFTEGHRLRQTVISEFPEQLEGVYGKGFNFIENKAEGLKDFRYTIVIENSQAKDYVSEKIIDCFITGTIPIYWGARNISDYFNMDGILTFNTIDDLKEIINNIGESDYNNRKNAITDNFNNCFQYRVLEDAIHTKLKELKVI